MNGVISGVGIYLLGLLTGILMPLAKDNASAALAIRKKIDDALFDLDEFLKLEPSDLRNIPADFAEKLALELRQDLHSMRWYRFFKFWLGLPPEKDLRAAIEKLSEITLRLHPKPGLYDFEYAGEALPIGREVKMLLRRRWSVF
jgi:hypothetical protein